MMAKTSAFDGNARAYDDWFEAHASYYQSELAAVRRLLPGTGEGIEIGVGTGRFAVPLGITAGVEPSPAMRAIALEKGINALDGVAEDLPVEPDTFDYALFVTTLCFLESLEVAFGEVFRILKPGGNVVIGFIEKDSPLGKIYQQRKNASRFYREATFHTVDQVIQVLESTGFVNFSFVQTLFPEEGDKETVQPVREGYGDGAFVVIRASKPGNG